MSTVVCVPVKDCAMWIEKFLAQIKHMKGVSRVIFSYGKSYDITLLLIKNWMKQNPKIKTELYNEPKLTALTSAQIGVIYQDFQEIVKKGDEENILLADADCMDIPPDTVTRLIADDKDIVAPYVWMRNCVPRMFYDSYVFRLNGFRYHPFNPPMLGGTIGKVDSVGTLFMVKRKVFLDVPYGNPYPHMKFCDDARAKGYEVWADPRININHLDLTRFGIAHFPIEQLLAGKPMPIPDFITNKGKRVTTAEIEEEMVKAWVYGV